MKESVYRTELTPVSFLERFNTPHTQLVEVISMRSPKLFRPG